MKKDLLSFIAVVCIFSLNAQNWCPPGATWHYKADYHGIGGTIEASRELRLSDTATSNGKLCKVITGRFWGIKYNKYIPSIPTTTIGWENSYHTYEDSGVVYIASGNGFDTIVDFNAVPGKKWLTALGKGCDLDPQVLTVIDTGHVTINGLYLKTITVDYYNNAVFIERLGNINGFLYLRSGCYLDDDDLGGIFTCYSDDTFPRYKREGATECYRTVSIDEIRMQHSIRLFPNSNTGSFQIELPLTSQITVFDITGMKVYEEKKDPGKTDIHVEYLLPGIYFVSIDNEYGRSVAKMIRE